jgi:UDP-3-O-acyl-N-acetylglucosamine deacetylase
VIPARTVSTDLAFQGPTLFGAAPTRAVVRPARDGGLRVRRTDLPGQPVLPADVALVDNSARASHNRRTVLRAGQASASTTEHLLSALWAAGVTDALIDLQPLSPPDPPPPIDAEVPMGDGSALVFARALVGHVVALPREAPPIAPVAPVLASDAGATIRLDPPAQGQAHRLIIRYDLAFDPAQGLPAQHAAFTIDWHDAHATLHAYVQEVAPARTFCTIAEREHFLAHGLFTHVAAGTVHVLADAHAPERLHNEAARHKVLDIIGDLALTGAGRPLVGTLTATRSGHTLNHRLAALLRPAD